MAISIAQANPQVTDCETDGAGTGWADFGAGAASSYNTDIFLQGTACRARLANNVTDAGMWFDYGSNISLIPDPVLGRGSAVGMWLWCTHPNQLAALASGGIQVLVGTTTTDFNRYQVLGSDNYPARGGWVRVWVNVSARTSFSGAGLTGSQARYFGIQYTIGTVSTTAQNIAIDQIHVFRAGASSTTTLVFSGGTSGSPEDMDAVVLADGASTRGLGIKYGAVLDNGGAIGINGRFQFGDASNACYIDQENKSFIFQDQQHVNYPAIALDLNNAGSGYRFTSCVFGARTVGRGSISAQGSLGTAEAVFEDCVFQRLSGISLNSTVINYNSCSFDGMSFVFINGNINGCSFKNPTAFACVVWGFLNALPTPDFLGVADNLTLDRSGATAYGITLDSQCPSTITLKGHSYIGFAAVDGSTGTEVIYNNTGREQTIVLTDGTPVPSIHNGAGASYIIINNRTWTITVQDADGNAITGEVEITVASTDPVPVELFHVETSATGEEDYTYPFADAGDTVTLLAFALGYEPFALTATRPGVDAEVVLQLTPDRNFDNP